MSPIPHAEARRHFRHRSFGAVIAAFTLVAAFLATTAPSQGAVAPAAQAAGPAPCSRSTPATDTSSG
jgi:hypothetical protein